MFIFASRKEFLTVIIKAPHTAIHLVNPSFRQDLSKSRYKMHCLCIKLCTAFPKKRGGGQPLSICQAVWSIEKFEIMKVVIMVIVRINDE